MGSRGGVVVLSEYMFGKRGSGFCIVHVTCLR